MSDFSSLPLLVSLAHIGFHSRFDARSILFNNRASIHNFRFANRFIALQRKKSLLHIFFFLHFHLKNRSQFFSFYCTSLGDNIFDRRDFRLSNLFWLKTTTTTTAARMEFIFEK
jgi:hypothetical protein